MTGADHPAAEPHPARLLPRSPQPGALLRGRPNLLVTEAAFQSAVIEALHLHGFLVTHFRPGRTAGGRVLTAVEGDTGCPDLIIARDGCVWLVELKTDEPGSRPTPGQRTWLTAASDLGAVWRPQHWPWIQQWMRQPFQEDR